MRGERQALRAGEYLVARACRRLPARVREERYEEWLAELPVILHDRDIGPAPLRVIRMLAFAADTLRGTTLAPGAYRSAYRGTHRSGNGKPTPLLLVCLMLLGAILLLLGCLLALPAYEAWIVYQLIAGPDLIFSATLVLVHLSAFVFFVARRVARRDSDADRWYAVSKIVAGAGLLVRAIASRSGWGHPLLFAIISYCGYAMSVACLGVSVVLLVRFFRESSTPDGERGGSPAGP